MTLKEIYREAFDAKVPLEHTFEKAALYNMHKFYKELMRIGAYWPFIREKMRHYYGQHEERLITQNLVDLLAHNFMIGLYMEDGCKWLCHNFASSSVSFEWTTTINGPSYWVWVSRKIRQIDDKRSGETWSQNIRLMHAKDSTI